MRRTSHAVPLFFAAALFLATGCSPADQGAAASSEGGGTGQASAAASSNALRSGLQGLLGRYRQNIVRSAELVPEEDYGYHPTDELRTVAHELAHVASSNVSMCAALAGADAPEQPDLSGLAEAGKDSIVAGVRRSFDYCDRAIAAFDDAARSDSVTLFGSYRTTKASGALLLAADWGDHYSRLATYMRMNDMLPPSARESSED